MSAKSAGRAEARDAKRIVIKVGSGILLSDGKPGSRLIGSLARQVAELTREGREVVIVSSGAIALGSHRLGWSEPGRSIPEKQAAAAVGQIDLSEMWRKHLDRHGLGAGQVLVTRGGLENRERFLNARHTLAALLRLGVVPIVNENDTVATDEIRFGDNDNLSATIVNLVAADLLVILTDVDGLYPEPPGDGKPVGEPWGCIEKIDAAVERAAGGSASAFGRGGMLTKLQAAKSAGRSGAATVLCNGWRKGVLVEVAAGDAVGTLFRAGSRLASRKHWLAFTARPRGRVVLDDGAVRAIQRGGRSLLPAGVVDADGSFGIGDTVACTNRAGDEIARGLVAYASEDIARIKGLPTGEIGQVLGYSNGDELIHRDDLVLLDHD